MTSTAVMEPTFFSSPDLFRAWLAEHHATAPELVVGFYKVGSGLPSITWPQSVDEALCYGWIDGRRQRIDDQSYLIRFTPRRPNSIWSTVNIERVAVLTAEGRMQPAGLAAFEKRKAESSEIYAYEQQAVALDPAYEQRFKANEAAWTFFEAQAAWYRKTATWWVMSAKREETRLKRLATLIEDSAHGRRIRPLDRNATSS